MAFERRDLLLIVGILFLLLGLIGAGLPPIYALVISIVIYAGIKIFVGRRKKLIAESIGEGICVNCGEKIVNKKCPNCDTKSWRIIRFVYTLCVWILSVLPQTCTTLTKRSTFSQSEFIILNILIIDRICK